MKRITSILLSVVMLFSVVAPFTAYAANNNPVIKGYYADPDIDLFGCKYWMYPTTDGNPGWSGTQFHAFSSDDLVNWKDEGVILDVADKTPGLNENGVQIASSSWSAGNAWAPTIECMDGKYYFYYCGRIKEDLLEKYAVKNPDGYYNDKAIGVAVSDTPAGPFVALDEPILYPAMLRDMGLGVGQVIDPSVFVDTDGSAYVFFGNGVAYGVKLGKDKATIDADTLIQYDIREFRESLVVFKRDGKYYFTWSDDDTASDNYRVNYCTMRSLSNSTPIVKDATILQKDDSKHIYGTGHQSILYIPSVDKYYIAYGRHNYTNGACYDDAGNFREACIDEITFNARGEILPITPTQTGVSPIIIHDYIVKSDVKATCTSDGEIIVDCAKCGEHKEERIPFLGHDYRESVKQYNRCDKPDEEIRECKRCGLKQVMPLGPVKKHSMATKVTKQATYAATGTMLHYCKNCSYKYNTTIAKLTVAKPTGVSISANKKSFVLKWKKNSKATGYQIQYSTDKNFKKSVKAVKITKNSTLSKTVKSLKAKKKYYVRIRCYKTYNKKNYYSGWVNKSVTTK